MKSADYPGASRGNTVTAKKGSDRKTHVHRVSIQKGDNGGYSVDAHHRYDDGKTMGIGEMPDSTHHAFTTFQEAHDALPEIFGESHPSTKPKKMPGGDADMPGPDD